MPSGELRARVAGLVGALHAARDAGAFAHARTLAGELEALLGERDRGERFDLPLLPLVEAAATAALALAELGDFGGALVSVTRARAVADEAGDLESLRHVDAVEGALHARFGDAALGARILEGIAAQGVGAPPDPRGSLAEAYRRLGRHDDAAAGLALVDATSGAAAAARLTTLARAEAARGHLETAAQTIERAVETAERNGARAAEGWARLASAEIARLRGDARIAEAELEATQELAEELALAPLVARCRALARALA